MAHFLDSVNLTRFSKGLLQCSVIQISNSLIFKLSVESVSEPFEIESIRSTTREFIGNLVYILAPFPRQTKNTNPYLGTRQKQAFPGSRPAVLDLQAKPCSSSRSSLMNYWFTDSPPFLGGMLYFDRGWPANTGQSRVQSDCWGVLRLFSTSASWRTRGSTSRSSRYTGQYTSGKVVLLLKAAIITRHMELTWMPFGYKRSWRLAGGQSKCCTIILWVLWYSWYIITRACRNSISILRVLFESMTFTKR